MKHLLLLCFLLTSLFSTRAFASCPGCVVTVPNTLSADTLYIDEAPNGEVGVYYEADLSFRLPQTTTPIAATDPSVPSGLNIANYKIKSVTGLPPGMSWEANSTDFDPSDETDGCGRICGVPLVSDTFFVEVIITARVIVIDQDATVLVPMYIAPASSNNAGFSVDNTRGCGSVTVQVTNNNPSNGNQGFSYQWDFGNGLMLTNEDPPAVTYDFAGTYIISYAATIDTTGFILTSLTIEAVGCDDFLGTPDVSFELFDDSGILFYTSAEQQNVEPPITFSNLNLRLDPGVYFIQVTDDDTIGSDDCGMLQFNVMSSAPVSSGDLTVDFTIINPTTSLTSFDTVQVFSNPQPPMILPAATQYCAGESVSLLASPYTEGYTWFADSAAVGTVSGTLFQGATAATYALQYTDTNGCTARSPEVVITENPLPTLSPNFSILNNNFVLQDSANFVGTFTLELFLGDSLVATNDVGPICLEQSGAYTVLITDPTTGCQVKRTQQVTLNPDVNCFVATRRPTPTTLSIAPNPAQQYIIINWATPFELVQAEWFSSTGEQIFTDRYDGMPLRKWQSQRPAQLMDGMYFLRMQAKDGSFSTSKVQIIH